jgi:hypothetical protein
VKWAFRECGYEVAIMNAMQYLHENSADKNTQARMTDGCGQFRFLK